MDEVLFFSCTSTSVFLFGSVCAVSLILELKTIIQIASVNYI